MSYFNGYGGWQRLLHDLNLDWIVKRIDKNSKDIEELKKGGGGGVTANIDASASVDQSIGNASVNVTKSVIDGTTTFDFAFSGIKGEQGIPGPAGSPGVPGSDGFSPVVSVSEIEGGHQVTVTDKDGSNTFDVMNGTEGIPGPAGSPGVPGSDGFSPVVSVSEIEGGHQVTVTDKDGAHTFDVMNGVQGPAGEQGIPGVPGPAGEQGIPGVPGSDGFSPVVSVTEVEGGHKVSITDSTGAKAFDVLDGSPGPAGEQGIPGPAGPSNVTPILTEGVQIATINGEAIYAPQGGGGGGEVFESTTDTDAFEETYQSISFFSIRKVGRLVNLNGLFYMSNGFTNTSLAKLLQAFCPERNLEFVCDIDVRTLNGTDWESISKYENTVYPSNRSKTTLAVNSDGSVVLKPATVLKIESSDIAMARVFVNVTYVTA